MEQRLETVLRLGITLQYVMFTVVSICLPLITVALITIQVKISAALEKKKPGEARNA